MKMLQNIVSQNPEGCVALLKKAGYDVPPTKSKKAVLGWCKQYLKERGEDAAAELIKAHPDYEAIKAVLVQEEPDPVSTKQSDRRTEPRLNACGCEGSAHFSCDGGQKCASCQARDYYFSVAGPRPSQGMEKNIKDSRDNTVQLLVGASLAIIAIGAFLHMNK